MERMDLEETPQLVEELSNVEHQLVEIQGKIHAMEQEVASKASGSGTACASLSIIPQLSQILEIQKRSVM